MKKKGSLLLSLLLSLVLICTACHSVTIKNPASSEDAASEEKKTKNSSSDKKQHDQDTARKDKDAGQTDSKEAKAEQERFEDFTEELFTQSVSESVLAAYSVLDFPQEYGITDYDYTLGEISREANDKTIQQYQDYIEELETFSYDFLTEEQQLLYDIMLTDFQDSIVLADYYLFSDYLSPLYGLPSSIPSYLGQFSLNTKTSVEDYLEILKLLPDCFEDILAFQKEKTDAGMGLPDFELEEIIDQCKEFTADADNHYLITSFNDRIETTEGLSDKEKADFKKTNEELIKNTIIPLYDQFAVELEAFRGKATIDGGLCQYTDGSEYYEALVRSETASDKSVEEIHELLEEQFEKDMATLTKLMYKDSELYDKMDDYPFDTSDPDEILAYLTEHIKDDFPSGYETNYTLNIVPKSLEKYQSPAYYYIPSIDNNTVNNIFINQYKDYADMDLYPVLAHEGFPGHMYQTTYFQNTNPNPIRALLSYTGYLEGWGLYSELYSYDLSGQEKSVAEFNRVINCIAYDVYCLSDIGINYEGWTREDTIDFVSSVGYGEDAGNSVYEAMVENPCSYMTYYLGYLEFMDMKETAKEELGNSFNVKAYHKFILDIGPSQFEIIHDRFDDWLELQKSVS